MWRSGLGMRGAVGLIAMVVAAGGGACDDLLTAPASPDDGGAAGAADGESPEDRARRNSDDGAAEIAVSDRGVDEDGERLWKQSARAFFDRQANPRNATFELPWSWAEQFSKTAYEAGAPEVWMTSISEFELGGQVMHITDNMVVVLPTGPAARERIFDAYHRAVGAEEEGGEATPDVGQPYLFIYGD